MADYFAKLTDTGFLEDVVVIVAAVMGAALVERVGEQFVPMDLPSEAYGAILIVLVEMPMVPVSGQTKRIAQLGGGVYAIDNAAKRFGIQQRLMEAI